MMIVKMISTGEDVEHSNPGESGRGNCEEEGEQVHERENGPSIQDKN